MMMMMMMTTTTTTTRCSPENAALLKVYSDSAKRKGGLHILGFPMTEIISTKQKI
jgi:hypothetical protein